MASLIGVLSDAHGNGYAFDIAISVLQAHGADKIYFLGDSVGYFPSNSVLRSIESLGTRVNCILGNHEYMLLNDQHPDDHIYQLRAIKDNISPTQLAMISEWPEKIFESFGGHRLLFVHGSPSDPTFGYVYPDSDISEFEVDADWVFMGHTHHPFTKFSAGVQYVNVGSCGLPRDDGRYGAAALFDPVCGTVRILRFDITPSLVRSADQFGELHPSVCEVLARRKSTIVGEIV